MVQRIRIYESPSFDPYWNLAVEKQLMDIAEPDECILYLWQNQNTVVIGHNQNAWAECRTSLLEQEQGHLARRLSGGGAVFHDLGNLNFTFLMSKENYDLDRQLEVIRQACALAGIQAEKSGRNDLLTQGQKFSGNAFYQSRTHAYHHGTLLIDVDLNKLQRYLSPPKAKLATKGVASVRSRVINLHELSPTLTTESMKDYMRAAFETVYSCKASAVSLTTADLQSIDRLRQEYSSWTYLYGAPLPFTFACEAHYAWGHIQLQLCAKHGNITDVKVYSDAMDWQLPQQVEAALTGCRFALVDMQQALWEQLDNMQIADDLCTLLQKQQL